MAARHLPFQDGNEIAIFSLKLEQKYHADYARVITVMLVLVPGLVFQIELFTVTPIFPDLAVGLA